MSRSADPPALAAWHRLGAERPAAPSLSTDGQTWWSRAELVERVAAVPWISPPGASVHGGPTGVRVVPPDDPAIALVSLLAALAHDEVAVVAPPASLPVVLDAVVAAVGEGRIGPGRLVVATSGTTGLPRAVVRTWPSWTTSFAAFDTVLRPEPDDVMWVPGPVLATMTLFGLCHGVLTGLPVVATGRWRSGAPVPDQVTLAHCLPAVVADLLGRPTASRLRRAVVAGAGGATRLRSPAAARGVEVVEYYGAAELSFVGVDVDGAGFAPFPGVAVELRQGEVWVRSAFVALGYLAAEGLDAQAPLRSDEQGWAGVGDRAAATPSRDRFALLGRPEAALVGGYTVVLADVEAVLASVAGVADVGCLAVPDAVLGQQVVAVLALDPAGPAHAGDPVARQVLRRRARETVRAQLPQARALMLRLVPALPRTSAGKIDRVALAELAARPERPDLP